MKDKIYNIISTSLVFILSWFSSLSFAQESIEMLNLTLKDGTSISYNVTEIDKMFFSFEETETDNIEFVDLGLSVKWAKWNLGAEFQSDNGNQYAWGETVSKKRFLNTDYSYPSQLFKTPYDTQSIHIGGTLLDAASSEFGNGARMPSLKDLTELITKCDIEEYYESNPEFKRYFKFTGPSGKSIYIQRDDEFWLQDGYSSSHSKMMYLQASFYNDWSLGFIDSPYKGKYIRPVQEIRIDTPPHIVIIHEYDETFKSNFLTLEIDQSIIEKYNITCPSTSSYVEYSDIGFLYSSEPDIIKTKRNYKIGNFFKRNGKYTTYNLSELNNGTTYYAIPFIVIGGVYYYGDEINFKAGSKLPTYKVGDYYPNANNPIGVVCYTESNGTHGKIISFDENIYAWDFNLPSYQGASSGDNGNNNTNKISAPGAVAPKWCKNHGDGWYWPARFELTQFSKNVTIINSAIKAYGGKEIDGLYWSSTEYGPQAEDLAYIVCLAETSAMGYNSGWNNWTGKQNKHNVRAMKKF